MVQRTPFWRTTPLLLLPLLAGGGWLAWSQWFPSPAVRYQTQPLTRGSIAQTVSANGSLNPVTLVNVGTQVSGTVRKLHVDFNDKVEQGQMLLELDDALLAAQARQSAATLENVRASLELALANEQRILALFAREYVSRQERDQVVQARKSAQAQVAQAQAQTDKDRVNLAYAQIRSPVSGVVVDRMVDVGQTVAASFQTPTLIRIAQDLARMQIDASFAEADIGKIAVGQPVRFTVDAHPNQTFHGVVRQIRLNAAVQQNVVTYDVVVAVDNPEQRLLPGMTAYVTIVTAERSEALLVPNAALRFKPTAGKGAPGGGSPAASGKGGGGDGRGEGKGGAGKGGGEKRSRASLDGGGWGTLHLWRDEALHPVAASLGITDNRFTEILEPKEEAQAPPLAEGMLVVTGEIPPDDGGTSGPSGPPMRMRLF
ncbi:MAG: efflux RND transporter periplasmic adaptor subunit [Magnetococcales bacterium]|nr:efflux RND transporter periplasmic adaptor subunit [Magnetococcales bacterium]